MEKPFGTDLASAVSLNARLHEVFQEKQTFPTDYFLGKRSRRRTSSPSVPPTACSSRSGTAISLTTFRSTCLRPSASAGTRASLRPPAPAATWWSCIGSRSWVLAMEPPAALEPAPISEEKKKLFRSMLPIQPGDDRGISPWCEPANAMLLPRDAPRRVRGRARAGRQAPICTRFSGRPGTLQRSAHSEPASRSPGWRRAAAEVT